MESKEKIKQDYIAFNQTIEQRTQEEIKKIHADADALKAQAARVAESMIPPKVSEKIS
jgi:cell division protein FtsB